MLIFRGCSYKIIVSEVATRSEQPGQWNVDILGSIFFLKVYAVVVVQEMNLAAGVRLKPDVLSPLHRLVYGKVAEFPL